MGVRKKGRKKRTPLQRPVKEIEGIYASFSFSFAEIFGTCCWVLNANYAHGNRPDYLNGAKPDEANRLYEHFKKLLGERVKNVESGVFGADMRTEMSTDGPVTIVMNSAVLRRKK